MCEELGYLPLAIKQAGAYIAETGITAQEYHRLLETYPAQMYRSAAEGSDTERAIARLWHVTLDRLAGDKLAVRCCASWPGSLLTTSPGPCWTGSPNRLRCLRATGRLAAYSMITLDAAAERSRCTGWCRP